MTRKIELIRLKHNKSRGEKNIDLVIKFVLKNLSHFYLIVSKYSYVNHENL